MKKSHVNDQSDNDTLGRARTIWQMSAASMRA